MLTATSVSCVCAVYLPMLPETTNQITTALLGDVCYPAIRGSLSGNVWHTCPTCHVIAKMVQSLSALVGRGPHSPFSDTFVGSDDGRLDVDGVVPHPAQLHGLVQGSHHVQGIMALCAGDEKQVSCTASRSSPLKKRLKRLLREKETQRQGATELGKWPLCWASSQQGPPGHGGAGAHPAGLGPRTEPLPGWDLSPPHVSPGSCGQHSCPRPHNAPPSDKVGTSRSNICPWLTGQHRACDASLGSLLSAAGSQCAHALLALGPWAPQGISVGTWPFAPLRAHLRWHL